VASKAQGTVETTQAVSVPRATRTERIIRAFKRNMSWPLFVGLLTAASAFVLLIGYYKVMIKTDDEGLTQFAEASFQLLFTILSASSGILITLHVEKLSMRRGTIEAAERGIDHLFMLARAISDTEGLCVEHVPRAQRKGVELQFQRLADMTEIARLHWTNHAEDYDLERRAEQLSNWQESAKTGGRNDGLNGLPILGPGEALPEVKQGED
jgi:hypothetical protein